MGYIYCGKKEIAKTLDLSLEASMNSSSNSDTYLFDLIFENPASGTLFIDGKKVMIFEDQMKVSCSCPINKGPFAARIILKKPAVLTYINAVNNTIWGPEPTGID